jgi:hypothetical protein
VAAQHDVKHLGQPKSGPCRLMDAACGSVSLDQMTNLDLRGIDPPSEGLPNRRDLADDPDHAKQKTCPMRSG